MQEKHQSARKTKTQNQIKKTTKAKLENHQKNKSQKD